MCWHTIHAVRSTVRKDILRRDYSSSLCQNMVLVDLNLGDLKVRTELNGSILENKEKQGSIVGTSADEEIGGKYT